ncbi:MAG: GNAT family N-acetyltransferase [Betaproteobacteria bacterium]|nr:GNAT family N-acetyltransferase [Betaproteobacteria bacterium]
MLAIETARIALRPFAADDAPRVAALLESGNVARTTALIPHPYTLADAESWIAMHRELARTGDEYIFAIARKPKRNVIGAIGVSKKPDRFGHIGYWIGEKYWGKGFATEALQSVVALGFDWLNAEFLTAVALEDNKASCRVLEKSNFTKAGVSEMAHRDERGTRRFVQYRLEREKWERARKLSR